MTIIIYGQTALFTPMASGVIESGYGGTLPESPFCRRVDYSCCPVMRSRDPSWFIPEILILLRVRGGVAGRAVAGRLLPPV